MNAYICIYMSYDEVYFFSTYTYACVFFSLQIHMHVTCPIIVCVSV